MRTEQDERITQQKQKYGFEAFYLMLSLLLGTLFIRAIILDQDFGRYVDQLIVMLIGAWYFTLRSILGGILFLPGSARTKAACGRGMFLSGMVAAVVLCICLAVGSLPLFGGGRILWHNALRVLLSALVFFAVWTSLMALFRRWSNRRAERDTD